MPSNRITDADGNNIDFDAIFGDDELSMVMVVENIERVGIDGHESRQIGKRGGPITWRCESFQDNASDAETFIASVKALAGRIVTAYDGYSRQYDNVEVVTVGPGNRKAVIKQGSDAVRVVLNVTLRTAVEG